MRDLYIKDESNVGMDMHHDHIYLFSNKYASLNVHLVELLVQGSANSVAMFRVPI
jgi:hypothetical protein